jgi:hypothetical protein
MNHVVDVGEAGDEAGEPTLTAARGNSYQAAAVGRHVGTDGADFYDPVLIHRPHPSSADCTTGPSVRAVNNAAPDGSPTGPDLANGGPPEEPPVDRAEQTALIAGVALPIKTIGSEAIYGNLHAGADRPSTLGQSGDSGANQTTASITVTTALSPPAAVSIPPSEANPVLEIIPISTGAGYLTIDLELDANAQRAPSSYISGWETAANLLSEYIHDPITINIEVGYTEYPGDDSSEGVGFASAAPVQSITDTYSQVRNFLLGTEASDVISAVDDLPNTTSLNGVTNFLVANAEAKAWKQISATNTAIDGYAGFGTGIASDAIVGVALHEFAHAMGRIVGSSGLSLFRYTSPGVHDFSSNIPTSASYFSINGGATTLANFGTLSDPSDFLNDSLTPNDPFDEHYTPGSTVQSLTTLDQTVLDMLGFGGPPPPAQLYDFYFVYNDGSFYYGTVADNSRYGYHTGEQISESTGYYYIWAAAGATARLVGSVQTTVYYAASNGTSYTPYDYNLGATDGSAGLGSEADLISANGGYYEYGVGGVYEATPPRTITGASAAGGSGGTLSISDGTHTANLALLGQYAASGFAAAPDAGGGTLVTYAVAQGGSDTATWLTSPQH